LKAFTTPGGQYRIYAKDLSAFLDKRRMETSGEFLKTIMESSNWNTLMIAADPSTNDAIKAKVEKSFPEFVVVQAFDWFEIGRKFSAEKPGFVLLDAELPGADVSKFIRTVKDDVTFGNSYIFLLTADPSDAVAADAVLSKPFNSSELKTIMESFEKQVAPAAIA